MINLKLSLLLLTVLVCNNAFCQEINKAKLDAFFDVLAEKDKAMGSIAISKNGTVLYSRAIGYSYTYNNKKIAATPQTKYRIGSITKVFTATLIFQLIEEGKLSLETTLDTYYPKLPNAKKITISNLLNHRSGLHNFTNDPEYLAYMTMPMDKAEMLVRFEKMEPDFSPNKKMLYSNTNYVVLGYIIEQLTHQSFAENVNERIATKLGLKDTYVGSKTNIDKKESYSYRFQKDWQQMPETNLEIPEGAGSIVSTPSDLCQFIEGLFNLKLVSKNSLIQMKTMKDNYGMGFMKFPFYTKELYGHTGRIDGFESIVEYLPEDSVTLAYCTNGIGCPMNDILVGALSIYYNREYAIPTFNGLAVNAEELDKYVGTYSSFQTSYSITIIKDSATLYAQTNVHNASPLVALKKDHFKYERNSNVLVFNPAKHQLTLHMGNNEFLFTKDK